MAKATWVNVNGNWKQVKNVWTKINGTWKQKVIPMGKIKNMWKEFIAYITSWRHKVDISDWYGQRTPVVADTEGNSYFLRPDKYFMKYSPDGTLLVKKRLDSTVGWYIFGNYIYFQKYNSNRDQGDVYRMDINTLEVEVLIPNFPHLEFLHVDYQNDLLLLVRTGSGQYHMNFYQLSNKKLIYTSAGCRVFHVEYPYYYTTKYYEGLRTRYIYKMDIIGKNRVWECKIPKSYSYNSYGSNLCILGQDNEYIYVFDNTYVDSNLKSRYIKVNKANGNKDRIEIMEQSYWGGSFYVYNGSIYYFEQGGILQKYSTYNFGLLSFKDLNIEDIGYSHDNMGITAEGDYLYFAMSSSRSANKTQLWGSEKRI